MKKKIIKYIKIVVGVILVIVLLKNCYGGYNGIMYKHLKTEENYKYYQMEYLKWKKSDRTSEYYIYCNTLSAEDAAPFLGMSVEMVDDKIDDKNRLTLELTEENYRILNINGFFDDVSENDIIELRVSDWIYMDGCFFYIAAVSYNGKEYLDIEVGIQNIIDIVKKNITIF